LLQFIISIKQRDQNRDTTGDPWNGRTLEWSTKSPPPLYNFAILPVVHDIDAFWQEKKKGVCQTNNKEYEDILMPKNTPMGFVISVFAFIFAFAIIWYIWWLAILGILGVVVSAVVHLSEEESEYVIPAKEIERMEK
jgi:cytochrome o ubiquinol oxidase subunit 1